MEIDDNMLSRGESRFYYAGTHSIDLSFDYWNSSICKTPSDSSLVAINLYNSGSERVVAYKTIGTHIYTCSITTFGKFNAAYYAYFFLTFDNNQNKYCGYHSDSVIMRSDG